MGDMVYKVTVKKETSERGTREEERAAARSSKFAERTLCPEDRAFRASWPHRSSQRSCWSTVKRSVCPQPDNVEKMAASQSSCERQMRLPVRV